MHHSLAVLFIGEARLMGEAVAEFGPPHEYLEFDQHAYNLAKVVFSELLMDDNDDLVALGEAVANLGKLELEQLEIDLAVVKNKGQEWRGINTGSARLKEQFRVEIAKIIANL